MGKAVPVRIGRHVHPHAHPEAAPTPVPTGIDYLSLVARRRAAELEGELIDYSALDASSDQPAADTESEEHLS